MLTTLLTTLSLLSTARTTELFSTLSEPTGSTLYTHRSTTWTGTDQRVAADFEAEADWVITGVQAFGWYSSAYSRVGIFTWNIFIYDSTGAGQNPGTIVAQRMGLTTFVDTIPNLGDVSITLADPIEIDAAGKYWICVQGVAPLGKGSWYWESSAVQTLNQWVRAANGASSANFAALNGPDAKFALLGQSAPAYPCVDDCSGLADGNYQSCEGCNGYVTCVAEQYLYQMACPASTVWDDVAKNCLGTSATCAVEVTPPESNGCIKSCAGREDGDYQSCRGCDVYATCTNGDIIDNRPCPNNQVWDDDAKECRNQSGTCP